MDTRHPLVVKLGSSTVTGGGHGPDATVLSALLAQIAEVRAAGRPVVLVSSGAVATGRSALAPGLPEPDSIGTKQVLAALGQPRLMALYQRLAEPLGICCAQVLLTRSDLESRRRYLNARDTLLGLLRHGVLPIVNENDTVATEEIRFGDNDLLSARVAGVVDARMLLLLTDQDGVYERDPRQHPDAPLLREIGPGPLPESLRQAVSGPAGRLGTGGMASKLAAAELARRSGCICVIARGSEPRVLPRAVAGEAVGTRFLASGSVLEARKRYLLAAAPCGELRIDAGAAAALAAGRSLLAVGIRALSGSFERGDAVRIADGAGRALGQGLASYGSADLQRLLGRRSDEIVTLLGYHYGDAAVHRDNLVLF